MHVRNPGTATRVASLRLLALLAAAVGCSGNIAGDGGGPPGTTPDPGGVSPGTGGSRGTTPSPGTMQPPGTTPPGMTPPMSPPAPVAARPCTAPDRQLERLTHAQFSNTVRDLLGDRSGAGLEFPKDPDATRFPNDADRTALTPLLTESYEATVTRLVDEAWARDAQRAKDRQPPYVRGCGLDKAIDRACAGTIVTTFAKRAWRRDVAAADLAPIDALIDAGVKAGATLEEATKGAVRAVLLSPDFLFRTNRAATQTGALRPLDDFSLASRLSYFAWGTMPDDRLLAAAAAGKLRDPQSYAEEVRRVLADDRADALIDGFFAAWLDTRRLRTHDLDDAAYPAFDDALRTALEAETHQFVRAFLREDLDARELVDAPFTFLDARLARHYGLPAPAGTGLVRVTLSDPKRGGLLTHGSILALTSPATRTSPVMRGKWVLQRLLCTEPPEPPGDVDTTPPPAKPATTLRTRLEQHRTNPTCATCHRLTDPYGFGLENYDPTGAWRDTDNGARIDAADRLISGEAFSTPQELRRLIKMDRRLPHCIAEQAFRYAVGRGPRPEDAADIDAAAAQFEAAQHRIRPLLTGIATSTRFRSVCMGVSP